MSELTPHQNQANMKTKINRLIVDIETSPCVGLFWRPGWKISIPHDNIMQESKIICICYKWEGARKVESLQWDENQCDKAMLVEFLEIANSADELIGHNGDKFDFPWIKARCIYHDLEVPPVWKTVDTLVIARRRFKFNSNRLDYLGQHLLGEGKLHTEFGLWKSILLEKCDKSMKAMVKYCKKDVDLLERVWKRLEPYHTPKTHVGCLNGLDKWTCPYTGSTDVQSRGRVITAAGTVKYRMRSNSGKWYQISEKAYREYREWKDEA